MSLTYLPEHADNARLALDLAEREAAHLAYTHRTLYALSIDLAWVRSLSEREDLAEKLDAFVGRFGRLQDHIGDKLLPRFSVLVGAQPKSLLDVLAYAERRQAGWKVRKSLSVPENSGISWYMNTCHQKNYFSKRCNPPNRPRKCCWMLSHVSKPMRNR